MRAGSGGALNFLRGATGPLIGLILLCAFLSLTTDTFLTLRNFLNVMDQVTVLGVMAIGMTLVILIGGIDLSVGSVLALSGMVMGFVGNHLGLPFGLAIIAALIASSFCGVVSGLMVTRLNMPAFIATLAMMSIARGLASMITNGEQIVGFPDWFSNLAIIRHFGFLTVTVAVMIVIVAIAWIVLTFRPAGRALYAIGGSAEVARLAGINVREATLIV
jgi:ribose transport system permease protein